MEREKIDLLIIKLFENQLTEAESKVLVNWLEDKDNLDYFNRFVEFNGLLNRQRRFDYEESLESVLKQLKKEEKTKSFTNFLKYAAVAVILLGIGGYFYFGSLQNAEPVPEVTKIEASKILPGSNKAILTLGDQSQIVLEEGEVFQSKNLRSEGEELVYSDSTPATNGESDAAEIRYNELTVPRGGQFRITLVDGSQVWLNSDSKIRYPEKFVTGKTRQVELLYGEAYFDVSSSENHDGDGFVVMVEGMQTEVLGTEFNIKAYPEEEIQTTLVEGSIALESGTDKVILKPYERATLGKDATSFEIETVDSFNDLLWKEGIFSFKNKSLKEIMTVLERWYDMEVEFQNTQLQEVEFTGNLSKDRAIEEIMNIMYLTNKINYEINDRTLILK